MLQVMGIFIRELTKDWEVMLQLKKYKIRSFIYKWEWFDEGNGK